VLDPAPRPWLSPAARAREAEIAAGWPATTNALANRVEALTAANAAIHDVECVNLNPATNVMNPRAEALLAAGLGSRPSLGHAGEKYEMGLEAIEQIEVLAAALAGRVMGARFAEVRVPSGSIANLYVFMATCRPGDVIVVPPPTIGGHVTHDVAGAAGLYGLEIRYAPVDAERYSVDVAGLAELVERVRPKLVTLGGSLNLLPHPVAEVAAVAHAAGAKLLFDAAHACGMFAGGVWPNPLDHGADAITMSTYKSLGGPPAGLVLTNSAELAARVDAIAHPGLSANFDVGNTAALAIALLDWIDHGHAYADAMVATAAALAGALDGHGIAPFATVDGPTTSHQFAVRAEVWGGGHTTAVRLRRANLLASAIGLPDGEGLRLGTPEIVRRGMTPPEMPELAELIARALTSDPDTVAADVTAFRGRFGGVAFVNNSR
jgi:glycine hydroxymethyltransferase